MRTPRTPGKKYTFEGQQLSIAEIMLLCPAIGSDKTVRKHLAAGRDTRKAMLSYDPRPARLAGAQLGRKNAVASGLNEQFMSKAKRK